MPDCTDRRFTTVSRRSRRDGFRHFRGAGRHSPESLFHQQGKALIMRWVTDHYPDVTAATETSTTAGTRRADVMLTWPDRHRVAVEVQYSPLSAASWLDRHTSYLDEGIIPLWLLGHLPNPHLPAVPHPEDGRPCEVKFTELHQAMSEAGVQPLWINPITEMIGTSWVTASPDADVRYPHPTEISRTYSVRPRGSSATGRFTADPLTTCTLKPAGLTTPTPSPSPTPRPPTSQRGPARSPTTRGLPQPCTRRAASRLRPHDVRPANGQNRTASGGTGGGPHRCTRT